MSIAAKPPGQPTISDARNFFKQQFSFLYLTAGFPDIIFS